jgi:hypothetical protein
MAVKKFKNAPLISRGSYSKHSFLNDLDQLYADLKTTCIADLAKKYTDKYGVPVYSGSIRYQVEKYFPEEWIRNILYKRKHVKKYR